MKKTILIFACLALVEITSVNAASTPFVKHTTENVVVLNQEVQFNTPSNVIVIEADYQFDVMEMASWPQIDFNSDVVNLTVYASVNETTIANVFSNNMRVPWQSEKIIYLNSPDSEKLICKKYLDCIKQC